MEPSAWDDAKDLMARGAKRVFGLALIGGPGLLVLFIMWRVAASSTGGDPRAGVVRGVVFVFLLLFLAASYFWMQWTLTWVPKRLLGVDYWND